MKGIKLRSTDFTELFALPDCIQRKFELRKKKKKKKKKSGY